MSEFIQHLRGVLRDGAGLTDKQLLEDYISRRDETAFAALVRRHGPMVWGVCHRVLRNHHAAEDAFQATFLVFVRRASSIASRELLANWLYGVAHQTALKARATAAKRKERERPVTEMPEPVVTQQDQWRDVQPVLDEELSRLPDKYRGVIVLCDLEGKTRKEVAVQLGCPEGTVASRLARARIMLAKRLTQRGIALSGGALAVVLTQQAVSAGVPKSVMVSTIKAASLFAAGKAAATGAISAKVAALTEGVVRTMLLTKLKVVMVLFVVAGLTATGVIYRTQAAESKTAPQVTKSDKPTPKVIGKRDKSPMPKRATEIDKIQGKWFVVKCEMGGKPSAIHPEESWTIEKSTINWSGRPRPVTLRFALNPAKHLKQIDMEVVGGQAPEGLQYQGIYNLGKDKLEVCYHIGGKERPNAFVTKEDAVVLLILRRQKEQPAEKKADKEKRAEKPARKVITTAGVHKLCDGIWEVEALQVEGGGDVAKDKNLKGFLRVTIINVPNQKFITFNRSFSENWPWFVSAPSPDTVLFYDGDKEMHLVTLSKKGTLESETTQLPKEWVALLTKQRPRPVGLKPYPGAKDGQVVPPPNR
jgi:RNA polymerase sigma factor (sigma-70 family)